jgi:hypothetical protein
VGVNLESIVHTANTLYSQFETMLSIAHLSAHVHKPLILLSTLHQPNICQSFVRTLAQILCIERHAKAFLRVSFATLIIFFMVFSGIGQSII